MITPNDDKIWDEDELIEIGIKPHIIPEYQELVTPLHDDDRQSLKDKIAKNRRLVYPIIITPSGRIIDGHNRFHLGNELKIPLSFKVEEYESVLDEKGAVIDLNYDRRHATLGEKIKMLMNREEIEKEKAKERQKASLPVKGQKGFRPVSGSNEPHIEKGRVAEIIAKEGNIPLSSYKRGKTILTKGSEQLQGKFLADLITPYEGCKEIREEEKKQKKIELMKEHAQNLDQKSLQELETRFNIINGNAIIECQKIPDNSISLIFTDPPYLEKDLYLYNELLKIAARVLKPGGSLITYAPHIHLKKVFQNMGNYDELNYYWIICCKQEIVTQTYSRRVLIHWKPLLWFVKGKPDEQMLKPMHDLIESKKPDKTTHPWAQSPIEAEEVIRNLTFHEEETVLDLFMGDGNTGIAAVRQRRRFFGFEINKERHENAVVRIKNALMEFKEQQEAKGKK